MSFFKKTSTKQSSIISNCTNKHPVLQYKTTVPTYKTTVPTYKTTVPTESFEPSEARLIDNYSRDLRRWQWHSDTNGDGRILRNDMDTKNPPNPGQIPTILNNVTPYPNKVTLMSTDGKHYWDGYDVPGDGHCFYHVLHRFLLQNELYPPDKQIQFVQVQRDGQSDVKNAVWYCRKRVLAELVTASHQFAGDGTVGRRLKITTEDVKPNYEDNFAMALVIRPKIDTELIEGLVDAKANRRTDAYATQLDIYLACITFDINIAIWNADGVTPGWTYHYFNGEIDREPCEDVLRERPICFMNYSRGIHYQTLVPVDPDAHPMVHITPHMSRNRHEEELEEFIHTLVEEMGFINVSRKRALEVLKSCQYDVTQAIRRYMHLYS